ncbi:MAG TPA: FUSC family protein, partial [Chthoniobacterales bacterium]|nr:FUSC family protein [Chthoniobacterales bacterium]
MATLTPLDERPPRWWEDVPFRQGLKMALAGMLAFYFALWQGLKSPGWAIFTVVVLTLAQYVGAIAEKSVLRAIGTLTGALIGIWLIGSHGSEPIFVMIVCFLVAAAGTTMFGGNRYPYAFFLAALTMLVVVNNTMTDPSQAWDVGVARTEEICVGIVASMIVTSVLWPRYARDEYRRNFRSALRDVGRIALERSRVLLESDDSGGRESDIRKLEGNFATRMNTLRLLIRYGQRESQYFRAKLPIRLQMIGELGACFEAAVSLGQRLPRHSRYRDLVADELQNLHDRLAEEFDELTMSENTTETNAALEEAVARCETRLIKVRDLGETKSIPIQEAMDFAAHYTALSDIVDRLRIIRSSLYKIRSTLEVITPHHLGKPEPFKLDAFWIRNGIKGGITATLALLYVNWINPPGGAALPFAAWLFTAMSRTYPGGEGDRRSFVYVIRAAIAGIPYSLLLLVITPFLADYFVMNVFLFIGLFLLGSTIASMGGISLYAQCGMLLFVGTISMNPQEPVGFQAIVDNYFGVVLALTLSSVVQRLLWPVLPQREICKLFAEYFANCRELLGNPDEAQLRKLQDRLALIPPEVASWVRVTTTPEYPKGESEKLLALLHTAQHLGYNILSARKLATLDIPAQIREELAENLKSIEAGSREALQVLEESFTKGRKTRTAASQMGIFRPIEPVLGRIRQEYLSGALHFPQAIPYLGAMDFLE